MTNNFTSDDAMFYDDKLIPPESYYACRLVFPGGLDNPPEVAYFCRESQKNGVKRTDFFTREMMRYNKTRRPIHESNKSYLQKAANDRSVEVMTKPLPKELQGPLALQTLAFNKPSYPYTKYIIQKKKINPRAYYIRVSGENRWFYFTSNVTEFPLMLWGEDSKHLDYYLTEDYNQRCIFFPYQLLLARFLVHKFNYMRIKSMTLPTPVYYYNDLDVPYIFKDSRLPSNFEIFDSWRGRHPRGGAYNEELVKIKGRLSCFPALSELSSMAEASSSSAGIVVSEPVPFEEEGPTLHDMVLQEEAAEVARVPEEAKAEEAAMGGGMEMTLPPSSPFYCFEALGPCDSPFFSSDSC